MKPIDDVRQISALTYGFIASKALFTALDLDLLTRIAGGATTLTALAPNQARISFVLHSGSQELSRQR